MSDIFKKMGGARFFDATIQAAWIGYWVMDATGWQGVSTVAEVAKITFASTSLSVTACFLVLNVTIGIVCLISEGVKAYMEAAVEKQSVDMECAETQSASI